MKNKAKLLHLLISVSISLLIFGIGITAFAQEDISEKVVIEVLERSDCKHCQDEKAFLTELQNKRDDIEVHYLDIEKEENNALWIQVTELERLSKSTPVTLVGNTLIHGFSTPETTGVKIESLIDKSIGKDTLTFKEYIQAGGAGMVESVENGTCDEEQGACGIEQKEELLVHVPFIGAVDVKKYSLPVLSIILGFVDGFNPCAMWVLITFLLILAQAGSKKRMWQIAGLFIVAEGIMYYLILNVWLTTWNFVKLENIVTPIIGIIAIAAGIYFLYEGICSDGTCKVTNSNQKQKISKKINALVEAELTIVTILGIIALALSVNVIEFACSIGIPQTFTKIIELNALSFFEQQLYMLIYILFYMIDDVIIFGIALFSFEKIGVTSKYAKFSHLIGGVLMILLGLILLINPALLIF